MKQTKSDFIDTKQTKAIQTKSNFIDTKQTKANLLKAIT